MRQDEGRGIMRRAFGGNRGDPPFQAFHHPILILIVTLASRRLGEAIGGWLVALPRTSGPIAVFLAVEQGPQFSQVATFGSLEGTVGQAFFATACAGFA